MNRIILAAALAASTIVLSPMSFAEESSAFAAHFAALQDSAAGDAFSGQALLTFKLAESESRRFLTLGVCGACDLNVRHVHGVGFH